LLVAASPVLAGQPFAVRPDMVGVALQTWGVALALGPLTEAESGSGRRLALASALFGTSVCVKQHLLAGWAVSVAMAVWGRLRGRPVFPALAWLIVPGAAIAGLVYGAEWLATGGRVWEATVVVASRVGRVHPASWGSVKILFMGVVGRSAGTLAVLASAGLIAAGRRPGAPRWLAAS